MNAASLDPRTFGVGRSIVANVSHGPAHARLRVFARPPVTPSSIDWTRSPSSLIRRAGAVGETDSSHLTRTLAADPSVRALFRRIYLTARAGSFADVSFHAAFRYPPSRVLRGLADTSGPSLCDVTTSLAISSGGAPGVLTLRRFNPVYGWSRGASTAAKCR